MRRLLGLLFGSAVVVAATLALLVFPGLLGTSGSRAVAAAPVQQIGMKVLVITDSTSCNTDNASAIAYCDWTNTLKREGVPFDTVVTNAASPGSVPLPGLSTTQPNGTQVANYEGVVAATSGAEGLSAAQWTTLQTFEQRFSVRQITAYAVPSADYGLGAPGAENLSNTSALTLTADGAKVFPYLNAVALDAGTFGYEGTPLAGAKVDTLISGPNGSTVLGVFTSADGRQTMFQTFNQNQFLLQSELLRHGELAWLTRSTYFGDQRNYMETHIDDNFLPDDKWDMTTHTTDYNPADALREVPADVDTAANWSVQNNFRIDMLFNGGGSQQFAADNNGSDPLLAEFQVKKGSFHWINHTWDHPNLDQGCAPAAYIQSEITQNTAWADQSGSNGTGGLGLTASTDPNSALGTNDPGALVTGEHSGLANLVPGNPGTVDPPEFDDAVVNATGGTFATAGNYTYAITDQYSPTGGESSASTTVVTLAANNAVNLTWSAVCHASDYKIYRQDPGSTSWTLVTTVNASPSDFGDNGPATLHFTDTNVGSASATAPPTVNTATETPYEQNTDLDNAFSAAGITDFGSDASKPYPNPATSTFNPGSPPSSQYPAGSTFSDGAATAIPRYPTNIFYNVATNAQEVDEYETIYNSPTCVPIPNVTTCNPAGTVFTIDSIIASVDAGMFNHMMGNDPRPHYFHQSNLMSQPGQGDGLYYETMNPILTEYHKYFAANAPIVQLTMGQIGTLLTEQAGWAANSGKVTAFIQGNTVTVSNGTGGSLEIPLTGTTVGSAYAGSQSGWTLAPAGTSTYTALAAWPAPPVVPPKVTPPTGPAPSSHGTPPVTVKHTPPATVTHKPPVKTSHPEPPHVVKRHVVKPRPRVVVQVAPKTVRVKPGAKVTVSLKCIAARGQFCTGRFTLKPMGQSVSHKFRIKASKIARIQVKLPKRARLAAGAARAGKHHRTMRAGLAIRTGQPQGGTKLTRGTLKIRI